MSKVSTLAAGMAALPLLVFAAPAFADSPGDLAGGSDIYQVRLTPSGTYTNTLSVSCDDVVKYSVKLSNTDFDKITDITVKAPLSGQMTASGTNAAGATTSTAGTVTVSANKGTLTYDTDFGTKLLDADGKAIKTLDSGITTTGVKVGDLNGSTIEFVQFQAKDVCETTPTTPTTPITPTTPQTPAKPAPKAAATPTELPHTGTGSTVAIIAAATAAVAGLAHRAFGLRRSVRS